MTRSPCQTGRWDGRRSSALSLARWLSALLLAALVPPSSAAAQTNLSVTVGLGGYYRRDRATPVELTLDNGGGPVRAYARLETGTPQYPQPDYRTEESTLPAGAHRRSYLYPLPARSGPAVEAALVVNGREIQRFKADGRVCVASDMLLVAAGQESRSVGFLSNIVLPGARGRGSPSYLYAGSTLPASLPDRAAGYAAADALFLADVAGDELSTAQQRAITDWVLGGGTLILAGGPNWQRLNTRFYSSFLPARLAGSTILSSASGLQVPGGPRGPAGQSFLAAASRPLPGATVMAKEGNLPLVISAPHGLGRVVFLAFDPLAPQFRSWDGAPGFWLRLMERGARGFSYTDQVLKADLYDYSDYSRSGLSLGVLLTEPVSKAVSAVSQADLPSLWLVAGFLLAYLVCLVPLNYALLRRRGRKEDAWLTSPLIMLVFAGTAYGMGCGMRGHRAILVRVAVIEGAAGSERARAVSYAGLFSPQRATYRVTCGDPDTQLMPIGRADSISGTVVSGDVDRIDDLRLDVWEMGTVRATGLANLGKGFTARRLGGAMEIANDSPADLENCYLVYGEGAVSAGTIATGKRIRVPVPAPTAGGLNADHLLPAAVAAALEGSPEERRLKEAILDGFTHRAYWYSGSRTASAAIPRPRHPVLVGWSRQPVADIRIEGKNLSGPSASLYLIHMP
jgi:hypothetical protein